MAASSVSISPRPSHHSFPSFRKVDLQVLAGEYRPGTLFMWDQLCLFDELVWGAAAPEMFVLAWELSGLHTNLVVVVAPGTENAWILRVMLTPEFLWFGLHWAGLPYPVQLSDYSSNLLPILHSHHLVAAMTLHYNMGVSNRWWELNNHLGLYLSPAAAAEPATVPPMEDLMPMEGIEVSVGVSAATVGTCVREYSPGMDVCEELGVSSAAPAPATADTSVREYSPGMDVCEDSAASSAPLLPREPRCCRSCPPDPSCCRNFFCRSRPRGLHPITSLAFELAGSRSISEPIALGSRNRSCSTLVVDSN
ncbi:uncharacterized protein N7515_002137 [Penicillium bovifimosum]|uniref:Uncharacterized protein n=1 Tax=Penicillium bovifimosum TaxID=126998 RepID=A0A9W9HBL9_9EURO|nr:uncharacterized protein N7515_002137 [Penicillium bovifimosum]KAJ5143350.1 hypothetical protein N7515_002137 [Penicillium bovifimosum]